MFSFGRNCYIFVFVIATECHACFRTNEHETISAKTGGSFYKECECSEEDQPLSNLKWLDNHDQVVQPGLGTDLPNVFTEKEGSSINLHIKNINKNLSGTYKCVTEIYGKEYVHSYTIDAYDPLYFYQTPNKQFITNGQDSKILCQPKSDTSVIVSWQKEQDDPLEITSDDKYRVEEDGLVFNNVTIHDAGVYICQARVIATNEEVDKYIKVEVMTKPEITEVRANPDAVVVVGQNLSIDCIATGNPLPEYHWNKTGTGQNRNFEEPHNTGKVSWRQELNTIIFDEIQADDIGNYSCYAQNEAGIAEMNIFVDVMIPPQITDFSNITENEGIIIPLVCGATGRPKPNISIAYIGNDPNKDELIYYKTMDNMTFIHLDKSLEGIYICNATNEVGSIVRAMYLTVLYKPNFETKEEYVWGWDGITVNLSCAHDSNPAAVINWRFQGNDLSPEENIEINKKLMSINTEYITVEVNNETDFGIYYCSAKNNLGEDTKRIMFNRGFKPGTINNVNIIDSTATSVTFQIYGPEKVIGPNIIGYTAQYDELKNYNITDIHINRTWSTTRPYKLDKLKPNTSYKVKFAAINIIGTGAWSEFLEFNTSDKSVPDPPMWDEEPIVLTSNSHVLKWKEPDDNGEPIDSYTLIYCPESDEEQCKVQKLSPTTTIELSDLEFNTTYFLELIAHNSQGDSMSSNISVSVPTPDYLESSTTILSSGAITAIAIVMVVLCLLLLDVLLLVWRRQGIIASCCYKKDTKRKEDALNSRDKKGLLPPTAELSRTDNGHREFEYNKTTGVVTGKHSAV